MLKHHLITLHLIYHVRPCSPPLSQRGRYEGLVIGCCTAARLKGHLILERAGKKGRRRRNKKRKPKRRHERKTSRKDRKHEGQREEVKKSEETAIDGMKKSKSRKKRNEKEEDPVLLVRSRESDDVGS